MQQSESKLDICILTYKRPELLKILLTSIVGQDLDGITIRIIIIDNDEKRSAQKNVLEFFNKHRIEYEYDIEPEKNISLARNRALSKVLSNTFVFVDDDEVVSRYWIKQLLLAADTYNADIVVGPVLPIYPDHTPNWIIKGKFFVRKRFETGTVRPYGGTGNVLIKKSTNTNHIFDANYGLTGGEDTDYFVRAKIKGAKIVWCDTAEVFENVLRSRLNIKWITQRGFRVGIAYSKILLPRLSTYQKIIWLLKRVTFLLLPLVTLPILILIGKHYFVTALVKIARNTGQFVGVFR